MEESASHVLATRKKYLALGIVLVLGGLTMAVLTFITVFGPILGVLIAFGGAMIIWKSGQHGSPPPD